MKKNILNTSVLAIAILSVFTACSDDFSNEVATDIANQSTGTADFTTYVALGNSLTSGYSNGTLYIEGQQNAYPVRMSERFAQVTPNMNPFVLPLVRDNIGGLLLNGVKIKDPRLELTQTGASLSTLSPQIMAGTPTTDVAKGINGTYYGNMGVPGAKSFHLLATGYGDVAGVATGKANPYFAYFASSSTVSVLDDALHQKPTFFSLWIGNNDVLSYATEGGDEAGKDQAGNYDPNTYGYNDITEPMVLSASIKGITDKMTDQGAKGVVGNIPDVTSIPYFTTVPYNALPLTADQATALNNGYASYNAAIKALVGVAITQTEATDRIITFVAGQNPVVILDPSLTNLTGVNAALLSMRQIKKGELLILSSSIQIKAGFGSTKPLDGKYVLTNSELLKLSTAISKYNTAIATIVANNPKLALADMNAEMKALSASGPNPVYKYDGIQYTSAYITGSAFSLDGVHPTPKGAALLANAFIKAINAKFSSTLLPFNPNAYPGL